MNTKKKIAIIAGDYPPFISGYGDYNFNLLREIKNRKIDVFIITTKNDNLINNEKTFKIEWKLSAIKKITNYLKRNRIEIVNIQYPNILYGRFNIVPHLIVIILRFSGFKISTTLHEFSNINVFRRFSEIVFLIFSNQIIVTSVVEKEAIQNFIPMLEKKISIISIGSNIPSVTHSPHSNKNVIANFGMFYPDREIKKVIDFMQKVESIVPDKYVFKMIGASHPYFLDYLEEMISYGKESVNALEWVIDSSQSEIEEQFKKIFLTILFYNDGASLRRGSLLASIVNGIPVITNGGSNANELRMLEEKGIFYTDFSAKKNIEIISNILDNNSFYDNCSNELKKYSTQFSFNRVAHDYENILFR